MPGEINSVSQAIKEFFGYLKYWQKTKEIRYLKAAAKNSQSLQRRAEKLYPELLNDKTYKRYKKAFAKYII